LSPGQQAIGDVVEYVEYLYVPAESTSIDFPAYVQMVTDYTNRTNTTLSNVSVSAPWTFASISAGASMRFEWREHERAKLGHPTNPAPPTPPPHLGNAHSEAAFVGEDSARIELPQIARNNGLQDRYFIAGKMRGDPDEMPADHWYRADCGSASANLVKTNVRILLQSTAAREDFFARMYGGTLDSAFKRFGVRACFTEITSNVRMEVDPAPSPPPPDNWRRPPSPPAFVYETITLATATGSSALFFAISALCCFGVAGTGARARHKSRMWGTKDQRMDTVRWAEEQSRREHGENILDGPFRPNYAQPAEKLATGFSFRGMAARYATVNQ